MVTSITVTIGTCPYCGEPWPKCTCGKATKPEVLDTFEPEPPPESELDAIERTPAPILREWVQWRGADGRLSLFHVRLSSAGALLCGRRAPLGAAADSMPPPGAKLCTACRQKKAALDRSFE